jgi:hypothetical protein
MTVPLYDSQETDVALKALGVLARLLPEPFLLLGGWAVYVTVNESYRRAHGSSYLGSRDIDVCFHVDPGQTTDALKSSTFAKALDVIVKAGYMPQGSYRFCKMARKADGMALTEEAAKEYQHYELSYLYIDMMVDNVHPQHKQVFRCDPLDEPLAARVFEDGDTVRHSMKGFEVIVPAPASLLATKLRSIPQRDKDDKLIKDACDIYSIIWHSPEGYSSIVRRVREEHPDDCARARRAMTDEVVTQAARHVGTGSSEFTRIIDFLDE